MKKVLSYLKPYWKQLVLVVILLFVQAICDLSLPNYMSEIINVGLQQGGITESAPKAIDQKGYELLTIFMTEEDRQTVADSYELITKDHEAYTNYLEDYPKLEEEDIYVLKSDHDKEELNTIFSTAMMSFTSLSEEMMQSENADVTDGSSIHIEAIYEMIPMLQTIPQEKIEALIEESSSSTSSLASQVGPVFVKMFYQELGVDTDQIQQNYIILTGAKMLGLALIIALTAVLVGFLASRIGTGFARDLRRSVFEKVEDFSNVEMKQYGPASLITRTTNDITQVQMLIVMGLRMICYAPIMGIGGIFMALAKSTSMSWIIALAVIVLICLIMVIFAIAMPKFNKVQ